MKQDVLSSLVLLAIAAAYAWANGQIADSTLSDEVGASGLPWALTYALTALGLLLLVRSVLVKRAGAVPADESPEDAHLPRAVGLLAFGAAYVLALPVVGYIVATAALMAAVAVYEGAPRRWTLPVVAVGGALLYWAVFVKLLGVKQPPGSLWQALF
jgi:putative tricarboxylic transport membrane protein